MQQKNKVYFVAVILKVLLVNPLAALNFANVLKIKKRLENKKTLKNQRKNVTKIKKRKKTFLHPCICARYLAGKFAGEPLRQCYRRPHCWPSPRGVFVASHSRKRFDSFVLGSERTEYLDEQQAESVYVHFVVVVRRVLQRQNQKTIQDFDRVDHVCVFLFS